MSEQSNVTSIDEAKEKEAPISEEFKIPEEIKKQIMALKRITMAHNVITQAQHGFQNFEAVAASLQFLQSLHLDLSEEIAKSPEAEKIPDLKPLFERKRKTADLEVAAKEAERINAQVDAEKATTPTLSKDA